MPPVASFAAKDPELETSITAIGHRLFSAMDGFREAGIFSKKGLYARLMEWSMQDPAFKTQLFRFVDVLPALSSSAEIVRHLQEYLGDRALDLNPAMKAGLAVSALAPGLLAGPVKSNVLAMASQFVAGESPEDLIKRIHRNTASGIATTIDLLGEAVVSEAEAHAFLQRNLAVLDTVSTALRGESKPGFSDIGPQGVLPRLNLSIKISALSPEINPADPESSISALKNRLRPILRRAAEVGALINFDMESYHLKDLTLALFKSVLEEAEFASMPDSPASTLDPPPRERPAVGIALQAYLRDCESDLRDLIAWARTHRRPLNVRLVKGAYWDYETILAQQRNWPSPVWPHKPETDAHFERLSRLLLENIDLITPNFATHNVRSVAHAIASADRLHLDPRAYEFQTLFGMADDLKHALVQCGYRVREYCAIGELLPGMAYLVRRLLENTSNEGFLRLRQTGEMTKEQLLANPIDQLPPKLNGTRTNQFFRNTPNTDFTRPHNREKMRNALDEARRPASTGAIGNHQNATTPAQPRPLVIGGRKIADRKAVASINPAHPEQVIGYWSRATLADTENALTAARAAQPGWAKLSVPDRARILECAADRMESRRFELNALEILEAGKPWQEADADVSEAIDFCRYYAAEMRQLDRPAVTQQVSGERCVQRWIPRGVGVVISPWNFPLAILCGMTAAPLVAGNTVIVKPAEQTSLIAAALMDILEEAGVPDGVVNLLTGFGEEIGPHLVSHPNIDFIAFTGSRPVGLKIWEAAAQTRPGQANLKKVVCEMGGKNALIIDNDADLDEAIPATLYSAFGFSGQKCSALSRLIVMEGVYEKFVRRLIAAAASLRIGDPALPGTVVGPVIDQETKTRILRLIEEGKRECTLAWQATIPEAVSNSGGTFVPPTIFTAVASGHVIAREEIFGPVLAIIKVHDLDTAFAVANSTDYALTGGLFSRSPRALERAERELMCGNVYLNRGITGAIVERHPFGGFRMSGGGTKAGGKGYLENFLFPRVIAENVMRRGFSPPESGE